MRTRRSAALLLVLAVSVVRCGDGAAPDAAPAGAAVAGPHVEVVDLARLERALPVTGARITVVNFWATWCAPCVAEIPDLLAATRARRDDGVAVVLVSYDLCTPGTGLTPASVVPMLRQFMAKQGIDCTVLVYDDAITALDQRYDLPGPLPATIVLDGKGRVVHCHEGSAARAEFDAMITAALAKP